MKVKHGVLLFALGLCAYIVGLLFKIEHWTGADELLLAATVLMVVGILLVTAKLLAYPRIKEFLNS